MKKSPSLFALAVTILVSASPAAAWQPEIVGFDRQGPADTGPSLAVANAVPAPQPEIVGYGGTTAEAGEPAIAEVQLAPLDPVYQPKPADPIALVTPSLVGAGS